ncbi:uncharacterized protein CG5098-like isoform X2 [Aricia agestis]|uniref:uncharacterized protein CG5098-like isoform X2 n=1 Tax=Aricia agestis TaxID=91739 RepID=UPI001C202AD7|nr:uncharacterized protein CG5098-like isoform X2 [Aricia agestis]
MSGGSQHNPNGRQSQLGSGWSPLQVANLLARVPQAHMASDRGVTWHTPTPPPHLYHVPAPSPPDPLQLGTIIPNCMQVMKGAGDSVFRHTATPPDHYRHTPTPPDNHTMRHTPSPGVKFIAPISADMFPLLPGRDKAPRDSELYPRGGVDLSVRGANGSPAPPPAPAPATPTAPALSVRDAPTINSLIARAAPHGRAVHARVDALLERLSAAPASPHSVIVHPRVHTPSPPSSNEDSADSCGAPPGSKRKRKPERTIRVPVPAPERAPSPPPPPAENGDAHAPPPPHPAHAPPSPSPPPPRRARSGSAETIDDIAAMIAGTDPAPVPAPPPPPEPDAPATVDKLESVLASPEPEKSPKSPPKSPEKPSAEPPPTAAAPRRRSARTSNESTNVPVESPSEAKPAEPEAAARSADPVSASLIEVEKQLESMFAGIDEPGEKPPAAEVEEKKQTAKARKRRKSAPTKGEKKASKRTSRASTGDERRKVARKKGAEKKKKDGSVKDAYAYDSGSNASSSRSRGPYIQIVGPRDSPVSVAVVNAAAGANDEARGDEWRNGLRARGLHASTLGLRYDASTPDASWLCAFCERGPHYSGLGDLFGPYALDTECDEYRSMDEASKRRFASSSGGAEVWFHEACGVWAPGLLAAGARIWGLAPAVCNARAARCGTCTRAGAAISCATRACPAAAHYPCATAWTLRDDFRALCPRHADSQ